MSMQARFVAIPPAKLDEITASPDRVEELFLPDITALSRLALSPVVQERMRSQTPKMLKDALERMPPQLRDQMLRNLGVDEGELDRPGVGDIIVKRMNERMAALRQPPRQTGKPAQTSISLDKAWHGLHYLLCGSAEPAPGPLGQAVFGGHEIGEDQGYGPARYFIAKEATEIANALNAPGLEPQLRLRFDPTAMLSLGIYPGGWDAGEVDWLIDAFHKLRDFYGAASEAGEAVVTLLE